MSVREIASSNQALYDNTVIVDGERFYKLTSLQRTCVVTSGSPTIELPANPIVGQRHWVVALSNPVTVQGGTGAADSPLAAAATPTVLAGNAILYIFADNAWCTECCENNANERCQFTIVFGIDEFPETSAPFFIGPGLSDFTSQQFALDVPLPFAGGAVESLAVKQNLAATPGGNTTYSLVVDDILQSPFDTTVDSGDTASHVTTPANPVPYASGGKVAIRVTPSQDPRSRPGLVIVTVGLTAPVLV